MPTDALTFIMEPRPVSPYPGATTIYLPNAPGAKERDRAFWERVSCDLRGWVRAPDLAPGVVPGEARLSARGEVDRIAKWGLELVFKERSCYSVEYVCTQEGLTQIR